METPHSKPRSKGNLFVAIKSCIRQLSSLKRIKTVVNDDIFTFFPNYNDSDVIYYKCFIIGKAIFTSE